MQEILGHAERFQQKTGIKMHYAGLPYVRATMTTKVASEMKLFVGLTIVMMALTLLMFFRTWSAVVFPLLIVGKFLGIFALIVGQFPGVFALVFGEFPGVFALVVGEFPGVFALVVGVYPGVFSLED